MPAVPLGVKAYGRPSAQQPETRLVNLYMEKDESGASPDELMRLQRPGLTRIKAYGSAVRAIYQSSNSIESETLIITGSSFQKIGGTVIGTVANDGTPARIEATSLAIGVVSAGIFYVWDGTTFTKVRVRSLEDADDTDNTYEDAPTIVDFDVLNGYFICGTESGTFYWLVPGETTFNPLNFATAEALPDALVGVRRLRDDIYFFGGDSIEVWQPTGDADATFTRAIGRMTDRGCHARDSIAVFDNSLVWVGNDRIVYRMSDVPQRISDFGIEERLLKATDTPSAFVFTSYGHTWYVLKIPGEGSFAYDAATQVWSEFASTASPVWRPDVGCNTADGALCGDISGKLYRLDPDSSLDDGAPFLRLVTGTVAIPAKPIANSSVEFGVGSDGPALFQLRWRGSREDWSTPLTIMARGEGDMLPFWRLGLARPPFRTFEFSTLAPTKVRISGAMANESWRV